MDNLYLVKRADEIVKSYFVYTKEDKDNWRSHCDDISHAEILGNKKYRFLDDCDGLAMTTIDYANKLGVPLDLMARVIVEAYPDGDTSKPEGHMVALYTDPVTKLSYYFGDTFGPVVEVSKRNHKQKLINYFKDKKDWIIRA